MSLSRIIHHSHSFTRLKIYHHFLVCISKAKTFSQLTLDVRILCLFSIGTLVLLGVLFLPEVFSLAFVVRLP